MLVICERASAGCLDSLAVCLCFFFSFSPSPPFFFFPNIPLITSHCFFHFSSLKKKKGRKAGEVGGGENGSLYVWLTNSGGCLLC